MDRFFVITGGPGSGKTTLVAALATHGFHVMPESGRAVIREQLADGGNALPWGDPAAFARLMLARDVASWKTAGKLKGPVIFDRGIPDIAGYLTLMGLAVIPQIKQAAMGLRYNCRVFIAPPWEAIFTQDAERKQTFAQAEATHRAMRAIYLNLGYNPVPLPLASVPERVEFVSGRIAVP